MATSETLDHEHHVYTKDEEIPFTPNGNDVFIRDKMEIVRDRRTGSAVNMLYVRRAVTMDEQDKYTLLQEAKILHHSRHSHFVKLIMTYFYEPEYYTRFAIIMELADGESRCLFYGQDKSQEDPQPVTVVRVLSERRSPYSWPWYRA
jgi:hypothetical protein